MQMPGEALLLKMWETLIEKGIGGLISPYYTVWKNKKLTLGAIELDKISKIAISEGEKEIDKLSNSQLLITNELESTSEQNNFATGMVQDYVRKNEVIRLIQEELNVTQAIIHANNRILNDKAPLPENEINLDWLHMWRDNASKVSDKEVQSLWGNVLAQEFIEPGRYSLRLLEFIKTLSKSDAQLIEKIAPFISDNWLIYERRGFSDNLFDHFNIKENEIDFLEEIGILLGVSASGKTATANNLRENENGFLASIKVSKDRIIAISSDHKDKVVQYQLYEVSRIGSEVLSLIEANINFDYVVWLGSQFVDDFKVEIFKKNENDYELEKVL